MNELAARLAHVNRLLQQRSYQEAIRILTRVLELEPCHRDALKNLAGIYALLRKPEQAKAYLDRLLLVMPSSSEVHSNAARNALALNQVELAIQLGHKAVSLTPQDVAARLTLADALEASGQFEQAKDQYLAVLERNPKNVIALSNLLSHTEWRVPERHELEARQLLLSNALSDAERTKLHFGLAHYYNGRQQYDQAFTHISAANAARHSWHPFDSDRFSSVVDELMRVFSSQRLRSVPVPVPGVRNARAIFIVGMPRSGTTLVEQILASHSQIAAGGELPTITSLATEIAKTPDGYPTGIFSLNASSLSHHAERYLNTLTSISATALRVTDKMPFNFLHLGLVAALFPDARIIHCRRDPLDTCTSCHFTTFNNNLQFASDLRTLGRYYLDYRRLMDHWKAVLTNPILEVDYESLVTDTESMIRRLVEFCGVDWEPGCAQFQQTERGILTPSRWQVRQPIYRHAVGRWRNYEEHLAPLLDILLPALASSARQPAATPRA
jgi:Flp pilus assembly protein TadD